MSTSRIFALAFATGLAAVAWVGFGFIGTSWLALALTAVIGGVFGVGAWELRQFRAGTAGLRGALDTLAATPGSLADWVAQVPAALRPPVRARVEGERVALPGPALTPYLVGLLVMLGMLGTFLGMVVTFQGAVFALQGSTDLQAIRSALAEPIRGLGLAFGTSVAGVAASAMLGLMSTVARRERQEAVRLLDAKASGVLQPFSLAHHRQETVRALQAQADALPHVAQALQAVVERMERRSEQLDAQLLERHAQLQQEIVRSHAELARQVGATLQDSVAASTRTAGESVRPVVEQALAGVVQQADRLHERLARATDAQARAVDDGMARVAAEALALQQRLADIARAQADALTRQLATSEQDRLQAWTDALEQRATAVADRAGEQSLQALHEVRRVLDQSRDLVETRAQAEAHWLQQHGERMDQLAALWRSELGALRDDEARRGEAAVQRLSELQGAVAQHLATLGAALEAPITRLLQTAAEVPQAAAGVIGELRQEMGRVAERDNLALQERATLLERLGALVQALEQAAVDQRGAIEAMVGTATTVLQEAQARFSQSLQAEAGHTAELAAHAAASAVELAGVAEAFGESVRHFHASHEQLAGTLQRVEASLQKSTARSDEQLAYYVAQAREVIDLSIASQQGLVDSLRQLQGKARPAPLAEGVA